MDGRGKDHCASVATAVPIQPRFKMTEDACSPCVPIPANRRRDLRVVCGVLFVIGTFILTGVLSGQDKGGAMGTTKPAPPRVIVKNDADGVRVVIPNKHSLGGIVFGSVFWAMATGALFLWLSPLRGTEGIRSSVRVWIVLWAIATCSIGFLFLQNFAGAEAVLIGPRSLARRYETLGIVIGGTDKYDLTGIKDLRVAPVLNQHGAPVMDLKMVAFDYIPEGSTDASTQALIGYDLDEADANLIADIIKKHQNASQH